MAMLAKLKDENPTCCDCGAKHPNWASANLGVVFCINCASKHRDLGVHVSLVKSFNLDRWEHSQVETCLQIGNRISNQYYEGMLGDDQVVREAPDIIARKYEMLEWAFKSELSPAERLQRGLAVDVFGDPPLVLSLRVESELDAVSGSLTASFATMGGETVATLPLDVVSDDRCVAWSSLDIEARLDRQVGQRRCRIVLPDGRDVTREHWNQPAVELLGLGAP